MEPSDIKDLFDDKYEKLLGLPYEQWQQTSPRSQSQAYARCEEFDRELSSSYDEWFEAQGDRKDELGDHREKLKAEYDLLVDAFNLEFEDRSW